MATPETASTWRLAVAGLVVWVATLVLVPAPLAARIFLLAPLVVVPRLVAFFPGRAWIGRLAGWPLFLAALPLVVAFALPTGLLPGVLALPWLLGALVGVAAAVRHGLPNLPSILFPRRLPELGIDVALGFWGVGALFAFLDRLGVDTGFSPVVVLLTATHFHFAGFGLLTVASLLAVERRWVSASVAGLIVGIPITALGFVLPSTMISAAGALVTGLSGIGVAVGLVTTRVHAPSDWMVRLAGVALLVGMPMGIAWSAAIATGQAFLDLDTMVRTHGALNATAVLLVVLAGRPRR